MAQASTQVVTTQTATTVQASIASTPNVCAGGGGSCVSVSNAKIVTGGDGGAGEDQGGADGSSSSSNGSTGSSSSNGLQPGVLAAIAVVCIVVVLGVGYMVYSSGQRKASPEERLASSLHYYGGSSKAAGFETSPAFTPHIAKGNTPQRYSGSSTGGRRSFGNTVEMSVYSAGYADRDAQVGSQNPHFASPRLQSSRSSIDGGRQSSGRLSFSR